MFASLYRYLIVQTPTLIFLFSDLLSAIREVVYLPITIAMLTRLVAMLQVYCPRVFIPVQEPIHSICPPNLCLWSAEP